MIRALVILTLFLTSAACVGRPPGDATGEEIYLQLCSNCHADDVSGSGGIGLPIGPGSNAANQPDEFLRMTILNGRGTMPSFRVSLNEDQLERLIGYIRAVQGE
ncbi:MAG: cytochrome c [Acidimicrobiia bacterium]|nr:cytochrome c [Acidimicrobiia bacterium]